MLPRPATVGRITATLLRAGYRIWPSRGGSSPYCLRDWVHVPMVLTDSWMLLDRAYALHVWHSSSIAAQLLGLACKLAISRYKRRKG